VNRALATPLVAAAVLSLAGVAPASGQGDSVPPGCSNLGEPAILYVLHGFERRPVSFTFTTGYIPNCDSPGDPLTASVAWGDGTSSPLPLEPALDNPSAFTATVQHVYAHSNPGALDPYGPPHGYQLIVTRRNERTGFEYTTRSTQATISPPPKIRVARLRWSRDHLFYGRIARVSQLPPVLTFSGPGPDGLRATIHWGDGTSSVGALRQTARGRSLELRASHTWRRRVRRGRLRVTLEFLRMKQSFRASRALSVR
jgi:hypothetical protein